MCMVRAIAPPSAAFPWRSGRTPSPATVRPPGAARSGRPTAGSWPVGSDAGSAVEPHVLAHHDGSAGVPVTELHVSVAHDAGDVRGEPDVEEVLGVVLLHSLRRGGALL